MFNCLFFSFVWMVLDAVGLRCFLYFNGSVFVIELLFDNVLVSKKFNLLLLKYRLCCECTVMDIADHRSQYS